MLSLKHTRLQVLPRFNTTVADLPHEILDHILQYIYQSNGRNLKSIFPISRACRRLRLSAYPILFEKLTIRANEDVIDKRSWDFLLSLLPHPDLLKYIRCLEIKPTLGFRALPIESDARSARMGNILSKKQLLKCLDLMTGLRFLRFHFISDLTFEIMEHLELTPNIQVSFDLRYTETCFGSPQSQRLKSILSSSPGWACGISLPTTRYTTGQGTHLAELIAVSKMTAIDWYDNYQTLTALVELGTTLPYLEEVHISSKILVVQDHLLSPGVIPWPSLKRLHVEGDRQIKQLLKSIIDQLVDLEELFLHASTSEAFHDNCLDTNTTTNRQRSQESLSYTRLPRLHRLSIRGVCPHLHVRHLTTPTLTSLSIVLPEYHARLRSFTESRPPPEIRWLASNLPYLTHLELHIGALENLWHPTAIPGVEVNVEVYAALHAISQIPHLRSLRLFPPYVPRSIGHDYLNAREPLSDEQAIRIFHHIHAQRPSLHTLSIAATFYALRGFSPMSWLVQSDSLAKTILTTRQAGKDYELEQTWVGERRVLMRNKRHTFRKPYLADLHGAWVFPVEDPAV